MRLTFEVTVRFCICISYGGHDYKFKRGFAALAYILGMDVEGEDLLLVL